MSSSHLYLVLAEQLRECIERGQFQPGERLPSIRKLSRDHQLSLNTVKAALNTLEDWRLIDVRPRSGHFVTGYNADIVDQFGRSNAPQREVPQTEIPKGGACVVKTSVATRLNAAIMDGTAATLGAAVQSHELMPIKAINRLFRQVLVELPEICHCYDAPPGCEELRIALAKRGAESGYHVGPDDIVITSGAKEAVYLSIKSVAPPGSIVAVQSPAYYALLEVLESLGLKAVEVGSHAEHGINLDHLDHVLSKYDVAALALVTNFSNPSGSVMPVEIKKQMVGILRRYDVPLVEDDVYGDLSFAPPRPKSVKAFDTDGRVLYCGSFSKTISPGLRLGWAIPGRYLEKLQLLKLVVNQATATVPQMVAARFLDSGNYDRHLRRIRSRFQEQMEDASRAVRSYFPAASRVSRPTGGHVLWVELPRDIDSMKLYQQASIEGIQIAPGPIFSPVGAFKNFIRINTGFPWTPELNRQVERIGKLIEEQR